MPIKFIGQAFYRLMGGVHPTRDSCKLGLWLFLKSLAHLEEKFRVRASHLCQRMAIELESLELPEHTEVLGDTKFKGLEYSFNSGTEIAKLMVIRAELPQCETSTILRIKDERRTQSKSENWEVKNRE